MTAIAGFWNGCDGDAQPRCAAVLEAQALYGSEAPRTEGSGDAAFGKRLHRALDDGRADDRPLRGASGLLLVADLRLDNRDELAAALAMTGRETAEVSDSALLLRALERWGERCIERLLGDFAFAWFDPCDRRLTLVRDYLGQRPLFYVREPSFAAFASMPSGLHALPGRFPVADLESVTRHIGVRAQAGSSSYYAGISRVPPGHLVMIEADGSVRSRCYWRPERETLRLPAFQDYVDAFRAELDRAVAVRLRGAGDVVGSHLSGGWDSSAVTATAARLAGARGGQIIALTSVPAHKVKAPRGRFADEGALARATAGRFANVDHRLVETPAQSPLASLAANDRLFQRPLFNPCNHVWLADLRAHARDAGAHVLLTGELGNWNISAAPTTLLADLVRERRWGPWWREARGLLRGGHARLRGVLARSFAPSFPEFVTRRLLLLSSGPPAGSETLLRPELVAALDRDDAAAGRAREAWPNDFHRQRLSALAEVDYGEYRKGVLAGWGIDKRDVTSDRRLMEFCISLPLDLLLKNGERRPLARAALADRLPEAVLVERNKGYQAADWHIALTRDLPAIRVLADRLGESEQAAALIDIPALKRLVDEWPQRGWDAAHLGARYRTALLHALAGGHFLLTART